MWLLPQFIYFIFRLYNRVDVEVTTDNIEQVEPPTGNETRFKNLISIIQDLANIGRDAFILIVFSLLLSVYSTYNHNIWASTWAAFVFALSWWLCAVLTVFTELQPIYGKVSPFNNGILGIGFIISIFVVYGYIFNNELK